MLRPAGFDISRRSVARMAQLEAPHACPAAECMRRYQSAAQLGKHWRAAHPTEPASAELLSSLHLRRNACGWAVRDVQPQDACQCPACRALWNACPVAGCEASWAEPAGLLRHLAGICSERAQAEHDTRSGSDTAADTHVSTARHAAAHPPSPLLDAPILTILQTVDWVLGLRVRTWKRVPAKFAPDVALEFSSMLTELAEAASEAAQVRALGKLWVFPTLVLCLPMERQSTRARARYLATRLKMWRSDALEPLLDSVPVVDGQHLRPIPPEAVEHRIVQHVRANHIGAAARLVESAGVHDVTDSVLARLRELHPEAGARSGSHDAALVAPVESVSIDQLQCMRVPWDAQAVRKSILAIPHTSGCGPSRWSIGVLQQVIRTPVAGDTALGAVALAFKRIASVGLHPQAGALWSHARLIPLKKKDGGVRPIAVGELLRRVLGKLVLAHLGSDAAESLRPDQYGVGRPAGLEGAVLGTRLAAMQSPAHSHCCSSTLRTRSTASTGPTLMRIVQGRFPALWPLVRSTYAHPAPLRVGAHVLASACGVQQGDPLGPLLFSLVLHKVLADTESPGLSSFWYLDDGSIVGPLAQLEGFLDAFSSDAAAYGMRVNRTKTQLVLPPGTQPAVVPAGLADLPRLAWDQAQLLGVPLDFTGSGESLVPITNASAQVLQLAEQVAKLSHPEEAFYLLRGSVGPKRLMHLARTMPPPVVTRIFAEFDRAWRSIVARALGVMAHEVGEPCNAEWRLPCSLGGLGLTAVADIAPFAFAAGSRAAARVVDNPPARVYPPSLAQWWRTFDGDAHAVAQWRLEPDEDVEALLDSQARGSRRFYRQLCSDWSHAPAPSDQTFTDVAASARRTALAWQLGMPSAAAGHGTHGRCAAESDAWRRVAVRHMLGLSATRSAAFRYPGAISAVRMPSAGPSWTSTVTTRSKCHLGPSRYGQHALVVDAVAAFARAAGLPVERGRSDGAALAAAARRKQASFQAAARTGDAAGVSFQAVILDTYGRREQCGAAFLETLVAAYMRHRGVSQMLASTALHRSLSLAVYRSVAAAVLLRHPGPTLPVASQHWLETGRRLFVGEVLSESEAESH
ncbi:RNA-directed DNA polymerase from mobile element jockey [Porphyridium purpureum]|uniref:RNA-directed DNA polymerase from mobile element jockey n=1 Tax=Porphyridium purpureum TaxID=35688 RepID=A0A5J4YIH5_PORPP|nr:RNA-directed DNA polymerase from mobile element jockey [Porphyridium purpureum]|eukprot:POR5722..scf271_22